MVGLAAFGVFDKETAALQPASVSHKVAVALETSGAIDSYRSVDPDEGWDAEYELDADDGLIRSRGTGPMTEVEYEAYFNSDLEDAIIAELERRGYAVE